VHHRAEHQRFSARTRAEVDYEIIASWRYEITNELAAFVLHFYSTLQENWFAVKRGVVRNPNADWRMHGFLSFDASVTECAHHPWAIASECIDP
jgi:hypothetical protein